MNFIKTKLPEIVIVEPSVYEDDRGFFMEVFHRDKFEREGIAPVFIQDNVSSSKKNTIRGLHYQYPQSQGKLISVVRGCVYDVAVDIRSGSPMFGEWIGIELSEENRRLLWVPPGFAHGFCVTSDQAVLSYKCTDLYAPEYEHSILWSDPAIGIQWPCEEAAVVSSKDQAGVALGEMDPAHLPTS